ncbi:high mobility group box domain-containing protein [Irpex rosettiformis]|uniref:High mobility group box domain-containing protein n=1 Tax=Irpex rosettiformis TaxID=378272 RepID=A0ACB8TUD0_9APHY|nr:high mobility group box domain-containing protein [Irpex rosettiformis]
MLLGVVSGGLTRRGIVSSCVLVVVFLQMPKEASKSTRSRKTEKAEKPAGRGKAKKDPKAPKRALSAYMFFSQDWRERVKAENPDAGFGEIGKLLGARWKELSDEEKKPYIEQAARDKDRAEQEKKDYDVCALLVIDVSVADMIPQNKANGSGSGDEDDDE